MPFFRKKPVVIEARQATGTPESNREIIDWTRGSQTPASMDKRVVQMGDGSALVDTYPSLTIATLEGDHCVSPGDWIIKGVAGEFSPCKPDIFAATYEPAETEEGAEVRPPNEDCTRCCGEGVDPDLHGFFDFEQRVACPHCPKDCE